MYWISNWNGIYHVQTFFFSSFFLTQNRWVSCFGTLCILVCHQLLRLILQRVILQRVGNQHPFAAELLATHHLPGGLLRSSAFVHDTFLLYVQLAYYGQAHLACNHVSIRNTISTPPGSMLPPQCCPRLGRNRCGRGSLVRLLLCGAKRRMAEDGGVWRRSCCCRCVRETPKGSWWWRSIDPSRKTKPRMQEAAGGTDARSIRSLVPDKAQDYGWWKEWIGECTDG